MEQFFRERNGIPHFIPLRPRFSTEAYWAFERMGRLPKGLLRYCISRQRDGAVVKQCRTAVQAKQWLLDHYLVQAQQEANDV